MPSKQVEEPWLPDYNIQPTASIYSWSELSRNQPQVQSNKWVTQPYKQDKLDDDNVMLQMHPILRRLSPVGLQVLLREAQIRDYGKNEMIYSQNSM